MAATNYKPYKPPTCVRCGKAIVQTKHGRRLYCYKCREEMQQANQHNYWVRKREANPKVPKKNCHINWEMGNKMILNGDPPQQIADTLGCSVHTVLSHKCQMKTGRKEASKPAADYGCQFFNYRAALDRMIAKLHAARGNGMDMAQFRKWLMTPPGQYVLAQINHALSQHEEWEQRFVDHSSGGWKSRAHQGNA